MRERLSTHFNSIWFLVGLFKLEFELLLLILIHTFSWCYWPFLSTWYRSFCWLTYRNFLEWFADRFTVLSYNILADYLAVEHRSRLYFHIPRHILDWEWRKRNIIFELGLWSADVMCFQVITLPCYALTDKEQAFLYLFFLFLFSYSFLSSSHLADVS